MTPFGWEFDKKKLWRPKEWMFNFKKKNEAHWFAVFIPILAILYDWKKKLKQKTAFRVIVLI